MRIYLAGPMRGIEAFNFPAFDEAAARGRALGHEVISPADMDREHKFDPANLTGTDAELVQEKFDLDAAMQRDLEAIRSSDAIALLPGWERSTGATAEYHVAKWGQKIILDATTFEPFADRQQPWVLGEADAVQDKQPVIECAAPKCPDYALPGRHYCLKHDSTKPEAAAPAIKYGDGFQVKDSGDRRRFATGAQRDMGAAKGLFHLIPFYPMERLAQLYEAGAKKYGRNNWRKGIPLSVFADSAMRHLMKLNDGWTDEDHGAAVLWNICGYLWTEDRCKRGLLPKELLDMPHYEEAA